MDHDVMKDPRVLGGGIGALVLVIILAIVCLVQSSSKGGLERALKTEQEARQQAEKDLAAARSDILSARALADKAKGERDEQAAARKAAEAAQAKDAKALTEAVAAKDEEAHNRIKATEDAAQAELERKRVADDRDHQYEARRKLQDSYDDLMKQFRELKQQVSQLEKK